MKAGFRQSMAWLHTWSGLIMGWLLFAIFATGTAAYFRDEITGWMQPEMHGEDVSPAFAATQAAGWLAENARGASLWMIDMPDERQAFLRLFWRGGPDGGGSAILDPATGDRAHVRETEGGGFFYYFHFDLMVPGKTGRYVVGFAAMAMLVAIVSGVITHRRIFRDFFLFRPRKGQRSWLDGHNVLAVMALPYHLMITYTGLVTLMVLYLPWGLDLAFPDGRSAFNERVYALASPEASSGISAPLAPLGPMLDAARQHWSGGVVGRITIANPGDATARVQLRRDDAERISVVPQVVTFTGIDGVVRNVRDDTGPAEAIRGTLYGLHLGRFAGPGLRWLFFVSGLAGTAMVATGLVLWTTKRAPSRPDLKPGFGVRLVRTLNVATIAGLPCAMAGYLWLNRILPPGIPARSDAEIAGFFAIWLAFYPLAALCPLRWAWCVALAGAAFAFAGVPLVNALTTTRGLTVSLAAGDWAFAGLDLVCLILGLSFAALSRISAPPARRACPLGTGMEA